MSEQNNSYPALSEKTWWAIREKFKASIPSSVYFSTELGNENTPLFKFCYDYITKQQKRFDDVENAFKEYSELVLYDQNRSNADEDIFILQTY